MTEVLYSGALTPAQVRNRGKRRLTDSEVAHVKSVVACKNADGLRELLRVTNAGEHPGWGELDETSQEWVRLEIISALEARESGAGVVEYVRLKALRQLDELEARIHRMQGRPTIGVYQATAEGGWQSAGVEERLVRKDL